MKKTAVLLYPEFSEYELTTALSILMQGGKPITIISQSKEPVKGEAGMTCLPELALDEVNVGDYDSLLLTGCMDIQEVAKSDEYIQFIKEISSQEGFVVASISSSPYLLAKAGVLKGKRYTVGLYEEARKATPYFEEENYVEELVVEDRNLITSRGSAFIEWGVRFGKALNLDFEAGWYGK
ncbi:DJ-1/PfpI family protein [Paucisalibacillus sp. EB02]|uniref:DJ-1/PfpI family protein n=1 Tax=Paucisalibacillus sp. EB02 TaxID=1347087 RepID=UPI0004B02E74|nr:DJ-1/PfpI family protein [Paucisalibacillus sp. EB02]